MSSSYLVLGNSEEETLKALFYSRLICGLNLYKAHFVEGVPDIERIEKIYKLRARYGVKA